MYLKYAKQLIEQGDAYYCFCGKEELESMKRTVAGKEISIYDKRCLHLSKEEVQAVWMQVNRTLSALICRQREPLHSMM